MNQAAGWKNQEQNIVHVGVRSAQLPTGREKADRTVAVFVTHGMGQQAPFTTMDDVAAGIKKAAAVASSPATEAKCVRIGDQTLQRLEFEVSAKDGKLVEVHVYEGYWAPFTEGQVTLRDVMVFLRDAGLNGLWNSFSKFRVWAFGKPNEFPEHRWITTALITALAIVGSLVVMNAVVAAVVAKRVFGHGGTAAWPSNNLLAVLTNITLGYLIVALVFGGALWAAMALRRFAGDAPEPAGKPTKSWQVWKAYNAVVQAMFWLWAGATIAAGATFIVAVAGSDWAIVRTWSMRLLIAPEKAAKWLWLWPILLWFSWRVRGLLVQYLGDVAAYVSAHKLDRFSDLRQKIKVAVCKVGRAIYSEVDAQGDRLYSRICVVGHSLGSVVAYDTLNGLLTEDEFSTGPRLDVAKRTKLLLTFGSPLDKIVFVFARRGATDHQRALAASVQPLIQDYAKFRQMDWVNISSPRDVISSKLSFFDEQGKNSQPGAKTVDNKTDPNAIIPLIAHTEYWKNPLIYKEILERL